jgi:glycosyltransferase involved in cell wall biosynthesis
MTPRIAVVEHGDAREARRLRAIGAPEPYFGMHDSQGYIDRWVAGRPHLIISLNAPHYRDEEGGGVLLGLPEPPRVSRLPGTITHLRWAQQISHQLRVFRPTHFLLRTGSLLGALLLRTAIRHHWFTLAMFAGVFPRSRPYDRLLTREIVRLLNHPRVFAAGNHRQPATDSMIEAGLNPNKAIAWDYTGVTREPADFPVKSWSGGPIEVVYAGVLSIAKGVGEVVDATMALRAAGRDVRLTLLGTGPDMAAFQARAVSMGNAITFLGRVANDEVFRRMSAATLVCVPSRHEFPEGFPQTLTEALIGRTPVIASDHPVFTRVLRDGEGLRYFPAGNSAELAKRIDAVVNDAVGYEALSRSTAIAFEKLRCRTRFHDVIEAWLPAPRA